MPEVGLAELLTLLMTWGVYVAIAAVGILLLHRVFGSGRTRR
jgi:hypothetical protein